MQPPGDPQLARAMQMQGLLSESEPVSRPPVVLDVIRIRVDRHEIALDTAQSAKELADVVQYQTKLDNAPPLETEIRLLNASRSHPPLARVVRRDRADVVAVAARDAGPSVVPLEVPLTRESLYLLGFAGSADGETAKYCRGRASFHAKPASDGDGWTINGLRVRTLADLVECVMNCGISCGRADLTREVLAPLDPTQVRRWLSAVPPVTVTPPRE